MDATDGRLIENLIHFGRALRAAGLPIGPGKLIHAVEAVRTVGLSRRDDFYWALHAVLVSRRPLDSECPAELPLVGGPVDGVGGQPMPV